MHLLFPLNHFEFISLTTSSPPSSSPSFFISLYSSTKFSSPPSFTSSLSVILNLYTSFATFSSPPSPLYFCHLPLQSPLLLQTILINTQNSLTLNATQRNTYFLFPFHHKLHITSLPSCRSLVAATLWRKHATQRNTYLYFPSTTNFHITPFFPLPSRRNTSSNARNTRPEPPCSNTRAYATPPN